MAMMGNPYDQENFFQQYSQMPRSQGGLAAAGEWQQLRALFPPLQGKRVLDLGCGYGWHCPLCCGARGNTGAGHRYKRTDACGSPAAQW